MQNRRLLLTAIIKLLTLLGLLLITLVFVNSLFTDDEYETKTVNNEIPVAMIDIAEMQPGQVRKTRWNNREVAVLFRQFSEKLAQNNSKNYKDDLQNANHSSIKTHWRSKKALYFVYYNVGDSKNCPLYYAAGVFKDICSSNKFNEAGRNLNDNAQSYKIPIPPHYFTKNTVIFGRWQP